MGTVPNLRNLNCKISVILGTVPEEKAHVIEPGDSEWSRAELGMPGASRETRDFTAFSIAGKLRGDL
jgi:hypothetical protein